MTVSGVSSPFVCADIIYLLVTNGLSHTYHLDESTFISRGVRRNLSFLFHFFDEFHVSKQNGPRWDAPDSAASHLGLFCLPMSNKKDARLIWVNNIAVWPTFELLTGLTTRSLCQLCLLNFSNPSISGSMARLWFWLHQFLVITYLFNICNLSICNFSFFVSRAGFWCWLYQFLVIAYFFAFCFLSCILAVIPSTKTNHVLLLRTTVVESYAELF